MIFWQILIGGKLLRFAFRRTRLDGFSCHRNKNTATAKAEATLNYVNFVAKKYIITCDWGTTNFRLRLIDPVKYQVISEIVSPDGVATVYQAWKDTNPNSHDKQAFFIEKLKQQVTQLAQKASKNQKILRGGEIVISGMATSSIGMVEMPYANMPFDLDGHQSNIHTLEATEDFPYKISLISGVRSENDALRGEETQLVGLAHLLTISAEKEYIFILPGTHSKHLYIKNNQLINCRTFMTGEMFNIISQHSILKDSIERGVENSFSQEEQNAFEKGVRTAQTSNILNNIFTVRTNQLFNTLTKKENFAYLSGLMIGAEIKDLLTIENPNFVLCSGNNLYEYYKTAMDVLDLSTRTIFVPAETVEKATIVGQLKIAGLKK
jgi:2-dehydro-3-deoxygalactonokinase